MDPCDENPCFQDESCRDFPNDDPRPNEDPRSDPNRGASPRERLAVSIREFSAPREFPNPLYLDPDPKDLDPANELERFTPEFAE